VIIDKTGKVARHWPKVSVKATSPMSSTR